MITLSTVGCLGAFQGGTIGGLGKPVLRPVAFHTCVANAPIDMDGAGVVAQAGTTDAMGNWALPAVSALVGRFNLHLKPTNYRPYLPVVEMPVSGHGVDYFIGTCGEGSFTPDPYHIVLPPLEAALPAPLTRDEALAVHTSFQGLTCNIDGQDWPWFDPVLSWLTAAQRQQAYACKRAAGDTAMDLYLPSGVPLYNDPAQFYSADKFGNLDATSGLTTLDQWFIDLLVEVRQAGFAPIIHTDERQDVSDKEIVLLLEGLANTHYGDLRNQVAYYLPGYDGVFPARSPDRINGWFKSARSLCLDCRFGLEPAMGYDVPQTCGCLDIDDIDVIVIEFEVDQIQNWNNWQIVPRLIGEDYYHRPADDTSPHPVASYRTTTSRGLQQVVCGEYSTYSWVRPGYVSVGYVQWERQYLVSEGCPVVW